VTNGEWEDYFTALSALEDNDDTFNLIMQNTFDLKQKQPEKISPSKQ